VFDDIKRTRQVDDVNNFWKYLAHDPALLARTWASVKEVMAPGALDPLTKEMVYLAVSVTNGCAYCIASHTAAARKAGMSEAMFGELMGVVGMANETNRLAMVTACRSIRRLNEKGEAYGFAPGPFCGAVGRRLPQRPSSNNEFRQSAPDTCKMSPGAKAAAHTFDAPLLCAVIWRRSDQRRGVCRRRTCRRRISGCRLIGCRRRHLSRCWRPRLVGSGVGSVLPGLTPHAEHNR